MFDFIRLVAALRTDRRGVTAVEYGIMAALIATALVTAMGTFATGLTGVFSKIGATLGSFAG